MITKTKSLTISAPQIWDVLSGHLFAINAIPKGWDLKEMSSLNLRFNMSPDPSKALYEFDVTLVKEEN